MIARVDPNEPFNVLGGPLQSCSTNPMAGFLRDGCCNTNDQDHGSHTVCVELTAEFLEFSKLAGNDLSTPMPEYGVPVQRFSWSPVSASPARIQTETLLT